MIAKNIIDCIDFAVREYANKELKQVTIYLRTGWFGRTYEALPSEGGVRGVRYVKVDTITDEYLIARVIGETIDWAKDRRESILDGSFTLDDIIRYAKQRIDFVKEVKV